MSHEIEADFVSDYPNEAAQCQNCTSFKLENGKYICTEAKSEVPPTAHCDFFQSID
ncbi:MAG: hypothetical protein WC523_03150 [Patescibacteria group bacterium]|jgi:hypothetical protein